MTLKVVLGFSRLYNDVHGNDNIYCSEVLFVFCVCSNSVETYGSKANSFEEFT